MSHSKHHYHHSESTTPKSSKRSSNASDYGLDNQHMLIAPSTVYSHNAHSQSNIKPSQFSMWVGTSDYVGGINDRVHTYTQLSQDKPIAKPRTLSTLFDWKKRFPYLVDILNSGPAPPIIHFESTISIFPVSTVDSLILGTNLEIMYLGCATTCQWECITRIYAPGKKVWEITQGVPHSEQYDGTTKLALPFASEFWAALYTGLSQQDQEYRPSSSSSSASKGYRRRSDNEARQAIGGITVVQEIVMSSLSGLGARERVAVLLWEFVKGEVNRAGTTQWREIVAPALAPTHQYNGSVYAAGANTSSLMSPSQHHQQNAQHHHQGLQEGEQQWPVMQMGTGYGYETEIFMGANDPFGTMPPGLSLPPMTMLTQEQGDMNYFTAGVCATPTGEGAESSSSGPESCLSSTVGGSQALARGQEESAQHQHHHYAQGYHQLQHHHEYVGMYTQASEQAIGISGGGGGEKREWGSPGSRRANGDGPAEGDYFGSAAAAGVQEGVWMEEAAVFIGQEYDGIAKEVEGGV